MALAALLTAFALSVSAARGDTHPQPLPLVHPVAGASFSPGPPTKTGNAICTTPTQSTPDVNTDCDGINPHNETSIAINPTDPANIIGGANDVQLTFNPGGRVFESALSRSHVTFDGGRSWSEYPLNSNSAYSATGDPAVAFDAGGHAYYATLGFRAVGPTKAQNPDVLVGNSGDKGRTWTVKRIAAGRGNSGSVGTSLDKEYIAAWGNGNAIVTWGNFTLAQKGVITQARIYSSVTHDAGASWSTPQVVSGGLVGAFVSVPTVAADGRVYVAFLNTFDLVGGRDDYELVEVSPATGALVAGPFNVARIIDGVDDYPVSSFGDQTYQDSIFRTWAAGNVTADPTDASHLAIVWSDMRNTPHPVPKDPYAARTNSDVIVSQSFDRGRTWSTPVAVPFSGDQWMPWGAYDKAGLLRVGTFDRSADPTNHAYRYTLLKETAKSSLNLVATRSSTAASDPTRDNLWFPATMNPAFPNATDFIGDYSNIATMPDGSGIVAYWTDLRNPVCFGSFCGHGQDAYFARAS